MIVDLPGRTDDEEDEIAFLDRHRDFIERRREALG